MKQLLDYVPLIFFFIVYKMEERVISIGSFDYTLGGIFSATEILVTMSILVYGGIFLINKKLERSQIITLIAVLVFCSFTIIFRDEAILKWKTPVVYWIFSGIFLFTHFFAEKKAIQHMMGHAISIPAKSWTHLNLAWAIFFFCLACANLFVAFTFHEYWVDFKVFGGLTLIIVFCIGQAFYLAKHIDSDKPDQNSTNEQAVEAQGKVSE